MNKIDIITINLNNADGLKKTIESVVNQTKFDLINYIIIDGGSTDGSLDIIKQYQDKIDYWVSEKDNGIYNAMNKGIKHIGGDGYCLFLNSGDYLHSNDVIERCMPYLLQEYGIIYGNEWKYGKKNYEAKYPDKLDENFFKRTSLLRQADFQTSPDTGRIADCRKDGARACRGLRPGV